MDAAVPSGRKRAKRQRVCVREIERGRYLGEGVLRPRLEQDGWMCKLGVVVDFCRTLKYVLKLNCFWCVLYIFSPIICRPQMVERGTHNIYQHFHTHTHPNTHPNTHTQRYPRQLHPFRLSACTRQRVFPH